MKLIGPLGIIMLVSFVAELMEHLIPLPITASIYGLMMMLVGLLTGLIPLKKVEKAADILVDMMPMMFIVPAVSLITRWEALREMLVPLLVICIVGTFVVMAVTGTAVQRILRRERLQRGEKEVEENK